MPWPRPKTLAEVVAQYRRQALAREAKVAKRLSGLYRKMERQFRKDLERVIGKIETAHMLGLPIEQSWLTQAESINELLARMRSYIDEFSAASGQIVVGGTKTAAIDGAAHAAGMAKAAGVRSGFRRLNENQLIDLFGSMQVGSPLYDLFRDLGPRAVAKARTIFGEAAIQGKNPRVIARRLATSIQNLTETRALLIARTETNRSYRGATLRSYRANSDVVTGWRWMSARNSRTCFVAGTPVLTSEGWKPIEQISIGDHVLTHAGNWMPVQAVMCRGVDRTVEVHSDIGSVECTPDHPFLTSGLAWVDADQLLGCEIVGLLESSANDFNRVPSRRRHEKPSVDPDDIEASGVECGILDCIPLGLVPVGVIDLDNQPITDKEVYGLADPGDLRLSYEWQSEQFDRDPGLPFWRRLAVVREPALAAAEMIASIVNRRKHADTLAALGAGDDPGRAAAFLRAELAPDLPFERPPAAPACMLAFWSQRLARWRTKSVRTGRACFDGELFPARWASLSDALRSTVILITLSGAETGLAARTRQEWLRAAFANAAHLRLRSASAVRTNLLVGSVTALAAKVLRVSGSMARRLKERRAANMAFEFKRHTVFRVVPQNKQTQVYDIQVFEDCSFVAGGYIVHNCPVCLAMDGTIHPLSEEFASHIACRCVASPITEYSDPYGETGEEWFARQSEEAQQKILGPSKFTLYKNGAIKLSDLVMRTDHPRWGPGLAEETVQSVVKKVKSPPRSPDAPAEP